MNLLNSLGFLLSLGASVGVAIWILAPLLGTHISLGKRRIILLFGVQLLYIGALTGWFYDLGDGLFWTVLYAFSLLLVLVAGHLLKRLDYYLEGILTEIMVILMLIVGMVTITAVWEIGIVFALPLVLVKTIWVLFPVLLWTIFRAFVQGVGTNWSIGIYIVLSAVKWIFFPHWGLISVLLVFVYSYLVGYVSYWLATTTRAEKVLSRNVSSAQLWFLLVIVTGILVVTF